MSNLSAVITGAVGSLLVILSSRLQVSCRVDDPVSASAVHGVPPAGRLPACRW